MGDVTVWAGDLVEEVETGRGRAKKIKLRRVKEVPVARHNFCILARAEEGGRKLFVKEKDQKAVCLAPRVVRTMR